MVATAANDGSDKYDGGAGDGDTLDYSNLASGEDININIGQSATDDFEAGTTDSWEVDCNWW